MEGTLNDGTTSLTTTVAELNIPMEIPGTTIADADRVIVNDNGTMKQVTVTDLSAYFDDEITAMPNLVTTGALNSGSITSGFGDINNGSSAITTSSGTITYGTLNDGTDDLTSTTSELNYLNNVGTTILTTSTVDTTNDKVIVWDVTARHVQISRFRRRVFL